MEVDIKDKDDAIFQDYIQSVKPPREGWISVVIFMNVEFIYPDAFEDSPIRDIVFEEGSLLERLLIISDTIS